MANRTDFWNNVLSFFDAESGMSARDRTARALLSNPEALALMAEEPEMLAAVFSGMVAVDLATRGLVLDETVEGVEALKAVLAGDADLYHGVAECLAVAPKLERASQAAARQYGSGADISYELYRPRRSP